MKSFHQRTILQHVDCLLVYSEEQVKLLSSLGKPLFTLKSSPKEVAPVIWKAKSILIHPDGFDYWMDILQVLHKKHPLSVKLFLFSGSDFTITDENIEFWTMIFPKAKFWIQNYTGSHPSCRILPIGVINPLNLKNKKKIHPLSYPISHLKTAKKDLNCMKC